MQSEHDQFIANLKKAQVEIACFEAALAALAEAQAALEALDESEDEDGYPTVEYPECSDNYGTLTVEQATALSAAATKAENEAKAGVRKSVLELDREELSYSEGCD